MSSLTLNDEKAKTLYDKLDNDLKAIMNIEQYKMVIAKLIEEKEKEKYEDEDEDEIEKDPNKLYIEYKKLNDALIVAKTEADKKAIYNKTITDIKVKLSHEDKDMILAYYKAIYAIEEEKKEEKNDQVKLVAELREAITLQLSKNAIYDKMITIINAKLSPEEKEVIFAYYENEYEEEYNDNDYDEVTLTNIEIMEAKIKIIAWLINID